MITVIAQSGYWSEPIVDLLVKEAKQTAPDSEVRLLRLSPSASEFPPVWREEMEAIVHSLHEKPSEQQLIALVGDIIWNLFREVDQGRLKETPLLLCGVKRFTLSYAAMNNLPALTTDSLVLTRSTMAPYPNAIIVCEPVSDFIKNSLNSIFKLYPETERVALVTSSRYYGVITNVIGEQLIREEYPNVEVEYLDGRFLTTAELDERLNALPERSVILLSSWYTAEGEELLTPSFWENRRPIIMLTNVVSASEVAVGGFFARRGGIGAVCASVMHRMLNNEGLEEELMSSLAYWNLNWEVVKANEIDVQHFNSDRTLYYNIPDGFYYTHQRELSAAIFLLIVALLFFGYKQVTRRYYMKRLLVKKERLERMNGELELANIKLEQANRLRSNFLNNLTHELKTPLNGLQGFATLLTDEELDKEERILFARMVHENALRLSTLFDEVIEISKIEAGSISFEHEELNVHQLLLLAGQSRTFDKHPIEIKLCSCVESNFRGDESRILQILDELISNALSHSPSDKPVVLGVLPEESELIFYVKDQGCGIAPENHQLIFERFFKIDEGETGSGLGLCLAKLLTEKMGGRIWVESALGEGATFYVALPR